MDRSRGTARALAAFIDPSLTWRDIAWLRSLTKMKIVLKGIQVCACVWVYVYVCAYVCVYV